MMGMLGHKLIGLPAPVGMLFLAVLLKLANVVSPRLQEGSQMVYKFFRTAVTYPILFAVGVAITPWQELGKRLHFNQPAGDRQYRLRAGGDRFPGW
ncbi:malate Na(+) symporter [Klebsiella pneumoniae]|uniref:Malate Na(+) symporter n=1 Tax=Klebsiella pneumoniae TaxID=573 RepID=A0A4P0XR63_KLEPN|nr:malate Na(+) symporter [Klebsiella pneumoniae]